MELKDPIMQLKPSNGCITAAMKTQMTTMIFNRKHHNHSLKYLRPQQSYHGTIIKNKCQMLAMFLNL